ncbi:MAG: Gfo/Idh/MocA family oxidoreductase [Acidobacteriota bacterium]|nr:Gfo/Idh/MocA family oxidoreductase [Acidobacteriota bacterium]
MSISRREFLVLSALGGAGLAVPPARRAQTAASDRVRVGIIGDCVRSVRHFAAYSSIPGVEVVAFCDTNELPSPAREPALANTGAGRAVRYSDWRGLLDRNDIDALSITTNQKTQAEIAAAACSIGKDVLLEYPNRSLDELTRLSRLAEANGRIVGQVYNARFSGSLEARSEITPYLLDQLNLARACRSMPLIKPQPGGPPTHSHEGYGQLLAAPVEELDYARGVLGVQAPSFVSCIALQQAGPSEVLRAGLRFVFDTASGPKAVELDLVGVPYKTSTANRNKEPAKFHQVGDTGFIAFAGEASAFNVTSNHGLLFDPCDSPSVWDNFIGCVRSRRPADLFAPVSDFTASLNMLRLAEISMTSGRPIKPATEIESAPGGC